MVENFRLNILFCERSQHTLNDKLNIMLPQLAIERICLDKRRHARMLLQHAIHGGPNQSRRNIVRTPDPKFSRGRISKEPDLVEALLQFVEYGDATFDKGAPTVSRCDALRA